MTSENQRVPGEHTGVVLARLRRQGKTVKEAAEAANVSERHAYRLLRDFDERPLMFERWSPSVATRRDQPEKIEWLFETYMDGDWWVEDADTAWSIHCADEELEPWVVKAFCRLYVAATGADPTTAVRNRMIIDWALWYRIWENGDALEGFVDSLPVTTKEELDFAAEVAHYLSAYAPADPDAEDKPQLKVQTVVKEVDDRQGYFKRAMKRAADERARQIKEAAARRLVGHTVPGESRRRARRRGRRQTPG